MLKMENKIKYYMLIVDKGNLKIELKLLKEKKALYKNCVILCDNKKINKYNNTIYFSKDRDLLKQFGKGFKNDWIMEYDEKLIKILNIKI